MTKCPDHPEVELRNEYYTGYCCKCPANHNLCLATLYMDRCTKLLGHEGKHCTSDGIEFDDDYLSDVNLFKRKKVEVIW